MSRGMRDRVAYDVADTSQLPQSSSRSSHSLMARRDWAWAVLGCALAATLFLSPALLTGRWLSAAEFTEPNQEYMALYGDMSFTDLRNPMFTPSA